jgi:hypothetical protein
MRTYKDLLQFTLDNANARRDFRAPEDAEVERLCERIGYGAVMDAASRLWMKKTGGGAFVCGPCYDTLAITLGAEKIGYLGDRSSK